MYAVNNVSIRFHVLCALGEAVMPERAPQQQQTLSVRISDELRARLERARKLAASTSGEPVSTSEIAKRFLEAARDDRLEVVDLLADPTGSLLQIRRKGEGGLVLSRAEWTAVAHFVRHGVEAVSAQAPHAVSRESLITLLDAFVAVYDLRPRDDARLDAFYLGNLPPEVRPDSTKRSTRSDNVRRAVTQMRRQLSDPATNVPLMLGRNLYVLLDESSLPGPEDLTRALRPYWSVLWRLAARGHYVLTGAPVREPFTAQDAAYRPPIPSLTEGPYALTFAHGPGHELSVMLCWPGDRGPRYPIVGYPRLAEFRAMLTDLADDTEPGDWTGLCFYAAVTTPTDTAPPEIWFRAHDNGITFG